MVTNLDPCSPSTTSNPQQLRQRRASCCCHSSVMSLSWTWLLLVVVTLVLLPSSVSSFGWLKHGGNTLSERLMGSRPEWIYSASSSSTSARYSSNPQGQQQQQSSTKRDQADMLEFILEPPGTAMVDDMDPLTPLDVETYDLLKCIVQAADGRKAMDIVALKVHHVSSLTSILVVLSGNSRPQNQAIASTIVKDVVDQFAALRPNRNSGIPEGSAESGWMVLDYGTIMVHIMTPKSRLFYNVQGQWLAKGAQSLDLTHMLLPNSPPSQSAPTDQSAELSSASFQQQQQPARDEEDPFWS